MSLIQPHPTPTLATDLFKIPRSRQLCLTDRDGERPARPANMRRCGQTSDQSAALPCIMGALVLQEKHLYKRGETAAENVSCILVGFVNNCNFFLFL